MTIKIVTDSSLTIAPDLITELDITVVPLSVMVAGVVYADTDLKAPGYFLSLMKEHKELPKTSQPPVGLFAETYERLIAEGADHIVSIHLTDSLSGTIEAARQGAQLAGLSDQVTVIDSYFTDQCQTFQVTAAARLAQAGASLEDIVAEVANVREHSELFIGVSTLENLVKGGRIGRVTGLLSSLLNIRVVMEMKDKTLTPVVKGRGAKTFNKWLDSFIIEKIEEQSIVEIGISYCGTPDMAEEFKDRLSSHTQAPITVLETTSVVQTHTGENAFAIMVHYA